ncbi:hypothetical protein C0995_006531, partial [Termitomyces sp. Mi166
HTASTLPPTMSTSFDHDSWSLPTTSMSTPMAAPLSCTSDQAPGILPILGTYHYKCTLEFPNSLVLHVVRHQEQGLKQAHNLFSSQLAAFAVGLANEEGCWFITIKGTNQQIGEALVVIGMCIAKWCVRTPWK